MISPLVLCNRTVLKLEQEAGIFYGSDCFQVGMDKTIIGNGNIWYLLLILKIDSISTFIPSFMQLDDILKKNINWLIVDEKKWPFCLYYETTGNV